MACSGGDALVEPLRQHFGEEIQRCLRSARSTQVQPTGIVKSERCRQVMIEKKLLINLCRACSNADHVRVSIGSVSQCSFTVLDIVPRFLVCSCDEWKVVYDNRHGPPFKFLHLSSIEKWETNGNGKC